jgi:hypothetical protein
LVIYGQKSFITLGPVVIRQISINFLLAKLTPFSEAIFLLSFKRSVESLKEVLCRGECGLQAFLGFSC